MIDGEEMPYAGSSITVNKQTPGLYKVEVHVYDGEDTYISTYKTTLIVKFVKREIRTLTIPDREKFLDAAHKIWTVGTDEGRKQYGSKFTGIHTYVKEHATASEDIMCDQFHEGSGFLTHHLALSNSFEAALRAVDPSVTLPYWDFSIDGQAIVDADEKPSYLLKTSPVFSSDWFGSVDKDDHIQDSRWAHSAMPATGRDDAATTPRNSYGYFRSYWNNNNDPEVVRHMFDVCGKEDVNKKIPSCTTHFAVMNATNLGAFQQLSPGDGHGPLHVQTGGVFGGCTEAYAKFNEKWGAYLDTDLTETEVSAHGYTLEQFSNKWGETGQRRAMFDKAIMGEWFHIYRGLWRSHMCAVDGASALMECPESCDSSSVDFEDCTCAVNKLGSGETTWQNMYPCLLNSEENRDYFSAAFSEEFLEETTKLVATSSVKEGEMLHSGSPADIMFWIIHPVIERLLAAKRVQHVERMGDQQFVKWDYTMDTNKDNWLSWSYYNLEAGANKFHPEAYTCKGHAADDWALPEKLPFSGVMMNADKDGDGHISNWEFLTALDPNNVHANDYVFDHFEWSHCEGKIEDAADM
eukprot:gene25774-32265_t